MSARLRLVLGTVLSAICIWWAMRDVRPTEVWHAMRQADYRGFVLAMVVTLLGFWIRALRWRWLLFTPKPVGLESLYRATMIGFMANNLLPFRLGEFVRAWALGRRERLSKTTVFATVVVERVVDMIALLAIFGLSLMLHPISASTEAGRLTRAGALILFVTCAGMTLLLVIVERNPAALRLKLDKHWGHSQGSIGSKISAALDRFAAGLRLFRDLPRLAWVMTLSLAMFGAFAFALQVMMWSFRIPVPWYAGLVMLVITAVGIMVPAAPGYIGTMNLACVAGLALFSVGKEQAVPFSWFYWAAQWIPVSAVGLYYLRLEGLSLQSLWHVQDNPT